MGKLKQMMSPYPKQTEMLMVVHYSHLSEKDRRHYAAIEAVKLGRGGTSYISRLLGISRTTVTSATRQLEQALASGGPMLVNRRQRKAGGGRKKKDAKTS